MMVVDTSALMAIIQNEASANVCEERLRQSDETIMSAVTFAELLVVAQSRGIGSQVQSLFEALDIEIVPVDETTAEQVAFAYKIWGKGYHKAHLNLADCFSYVTARTLNCPLLYIGNDFIHTDIESAL